MIGTIESIKVRMNFQSGYYLRFDLLFETDPIEKAGFKSLSILFSRRAVYFDFESKHFLLII
jgi:hypothetical protein